MLARVRSRGLVILVQLAILTSSLAAHAQRPPPNISNDRDLKEIDLTGWDCLNKPGGTARTPDAIERNTLKNRSATDIASLKLQDLDVAGFIQSVNPFDAATVHKRRKDLTPEQRQQLEPTEKEIVQVTGYLGVAYCGPPETTNCGSVDFHDWHLELFEKSPDRPPEPGDPTPIIAEITPRTQTAIFADKIRIQELAGFFRRSDLEYEATGHPARKIRVIGYRLWDDEHNGGADVGPTVRRINPNKYHNPWRQTAWEIHPVIKIVPVEPPMSPHPTTVARTVGTPLPSLAPAAASPPTASIPTATPPPQTPAPTATPVARTSTAQPPQPQVVTITKATTIQIPYGHTTLQPGTKLPLVTRDATTVTVQYLGEKYTIPARSTDVQ